MLGCERGIIGIGQAKQLERNTDEADLPTQQPEAEEQAWVPQSLVIRGWPAGAGCAPSERAKASGCLGKVGVSGSGSTCDSEQRAD